MKRELRIVNVDQWNSGRNFNGDAAQKGHKLMSFCTLLGFRPFQLSSLECMAGTTGLEPATSAVTGQRSNQLSYAPAGDGWS